MHIDAANAELKDIPVDLIDRNPANPRLVFREKELDNLLVSIKEYGIQVPISVYRHRNRYFLIDGERRWKCSLKLNKKTIPALIQDKPTPLQNLLLMFNIHALREQWDLLTVALKLPDVIELFTKEHNRAPNELELAAKTGLSRSVIRRCKLLIDLPDKYKDQILGELKKPKSQQKLTEDFFIEMERSLKTVERAMPSLVKNKDTVRGILIEKYEKGIISNLIHLRDISKIARAEYVEADKSTAEEVLKKVFSKNTYSIEDAYKNSVAEAYSERDLVSRINSILSRLEHLEAHDLDDNLRTSLKALIEQAARLIEE